MLKIHEVLEILLCQSDFVFNFVIINIPIKILVIYHFTLFCVELIMY